MNILIMSRSEIIRFAMQKRTESCAVISIRDVGSAAPVIKRDGNGIDTVLSLSFDDVEEGNNCITERDAKKIVSFVKSLGKSYENLIIHCEFGQSRSAGVAAAVSVMLTGDDSWIFEDSRYYINFTCYTKTLSAIDADAPVWRKFLDKLKFW